MKVVGNILFFIVALGAVIVMCCTYQLDRIFPIHNHFWRNFIQLKC